MASRSFTAGAALNAVTPLAGWLMASVGIGGYLFWALSGGLVREGNWIGVDFHVYYAAAQALRGGGDIYSNTISPPYVYPPLLAILTIPLTALSVTAATIFWKLLQHICLLAAGALLVSLIPPRIRPLAAGLLLLGWLTVPLQDEIRVGESNSLVLLLVVGALWIVARMEQRPDADNSPPGARFAVSPAAIGAGALLALAVSIKVLPVVLVAYLWWRGPRSVAAVATLGFLLLQAVLLLLTPATADYWLRHFPVLFGQAFPYLDNQSLNAFFSRALLPTGDPGVPPLQLANAEALRPALTWAANGLAVLATAWVLLRARQRSQPIDMPTRAVRLLLEAGLVLLLVHLVSGSTWLHHLVDLAVPVAGLLGAWWLARRTSMGGTRPLALLLGGSLAVLLHRPTEWVTAVSTIVPGAPLPAFLASNSALWVVAALWAAVAATLLCPNTQHLTPNT